MNKKGQGMVIDLMAAVLIFLIIGGSIMFVWADKEIEAEERFFENERITMAERTLDTMIKSNGLPANWEEYEGTNSEIADNIQMLGLAKRDRVLDVEKVEKFAELSNLDDTYAILRTKLLIGGNEYYFRIFDPEREKMDEEIIIAGKKPAGNVAEIRIRRPIIYTYHREEEDEAGEKSQREAITELTLYSPYWRI